MFLFNSVLAIESILKSVKEVIIEFHIEAHLGCIWKDTVFVSANS